MDKIISAFHELNKIPPFQKKVEDPSLLSTSDRLDTIQMNIGRGCNLTCKHCHLSCGPNRSEEMTRDVMAACLQYAREQEVSTIDITGGAPEMNPDFEWLVTEACKVCNHVIVRSNLVILLEEQYSHLPEFYAKEGVELFVSLPYYRAQEMDKVRGKGSFDKAIVMIQKLNELGYGKDPRLVLNMVYNPAGAFFPPDQTAMEIEYKQRLGEDFGIVFNNLFTLYNNPMGRFGNFLMRSRNLEKYMKKLYDAYNSDTIEALMCRFQISVDYDGRIYDCDFNLAAEMPIIPPVEIGTKGQTIFDFVGKPYFVRKIRVDKHCYACTAGAGSS